MHEARLARGRLQCRGRYFTSVTFAVIFVKCEQTTVVVCVRLTGQTLVRCTLNFIILKIGRVQGLTHCVMAHRCQEAKMGPNLCYNCTIVHDKHVCVALYLEDKYEQLGMESHQTTTDYTTAKLARHVWVQVRELYCQELCRDKNAMIEHVHFVRWTPNSSLHCSGSTGGQLQMMRLGLRSNRWKLQTSGELPIVVEESIESMSTCNRLD